MLLFWQQVRLFTSDTFGMDMGNFCREKKHRLLGSSGQTTVEYVLLLAVVFLIVFTIFRNPKFKEFMGENGAFFAATKGIIEHSYQFTLDGIFAWMDGFWIVYQCFNCRLLHAFSHYHGV